MKDSSLTVLSHGNSNEWNMLTETEMSHILGGIAPGYTCGKGYSETTSNGTTTIKCNCKYGPSLGACTSGYTPAVGGN